MEQQNNSDVNMSKEEIIEDRINQSESCEFPISTPLGEVGVDLLAFEKAHKNAKKIANPPEPNELNKQVQKFLGGEDLVDSTYWEPRLGGLIKFYTNKHFSEYELVKEFSYAKGIELEPEYGRVTLGKNHTEKFVQSGWRFYQNDDFKFVVNYSVDEYDNDERISIITTEFSKGLEMLNELEEGFYKSGPLKNRFFDMTYKILHRDETINDLIAWNHDIQEQLNKDVIQFLSIIPELKARGLPNSRGIILSGPPGTGKTMMAKSLANQTQISTMLISAEMIYAKNQVKTAFELARKLSPTLMIIEDIDTAGTVSRRFTDHPILGEYLQSMDGMEPNNGIVIVATTNHTENIDPAISDRPGRFDRIIEIPLPSQSQRKKVLQNYLRKLDCEEDIEETVATVAKSTDGLSGAWVREIAQTALIEAMYNGRQEIGKEDLISALKDVLKRRDMAYQPTTSLSLKISQKNAEPYTM